MYMTFSIGHNTLCKQDVLLVNCVLLMQILFQWTMKSAEGVLEQYTQIFFPVLFMSKEVRRAISFRVAHVQNILRNLDFFHGLCI